MLFTVNIAHLSGIDLESYNKCYSLQKEERENPTCFAKVCQHSNKIGQNIIP